MITYRKTKQGEWVAFGPVSEVVEGGVVTVTKRDGTTKREGIVRVGRAFSVDGVPHVYGYIEPRAPRRSRPRRASNGECMCGACADLLSVGYRPGARIRCPECGGWAEAC